MDSIDITDLEFSLENSDINSPISSEGSTIKDYSLFIYIGGAILIIIIGMFIYKYYQNKKQSQPNMNDLDCEGGFCTMNTNSSDI